MKRSRTVVRVVWALGLLLLLIILTSTIQSVRAAKQESQPTPGSMFVTDCVKIFGRSWSSSAAVCPC